MCQAGIQYRESLQGNRLVKPKYVLVYNSAVVTTASCPEGSFFCFIPAWRHHAWRTHTMAYSAGTAVQLAAPYGTRATEGDLHLEQQPLWPGPTAAAHPYNMSLGLTPMRASHHSCPAVAATGTTNATRCWCAVMCQQVGHDTLPPEQVSAS